MEVWRREEKVNIYKSRKMKNLREYIKTARQHNGPTGVTGHEIRIRLIDLDVCFCSDVFN